MESEAATRAGDAREPVLALPLPAERGQHWKLVWELLHDLSVILLFCAFVVMFVAQPFRVEGTSMLPALADGERIVVNKFIYRLHAIEYGDVVVFWWPPNPSQRFIKRVVARPGDRVELRAGVLYVNQKPVEERYLAREYRGDDDVPPHDVPPGYYYVLGDHRNASNDSRAWGEVPEKYIYGRAAFRFWPLGRMGVIR